MRHRRFLIAALLFQPLIGQTSDYQKDVHPVLAGKCFSCHGGDKRSGGLSLKDRDGVLAGGRSGVVVVPGDAAASLLMRKVSGEVQPAMPPVGPGLTPAELGALRSWIDQGARLTPAGPAAKSRFVPTLELTSPGGSLDSHLAQYWKTRSVRAPAPVSDLQFARRAYLDLWGFVPAPEQLREFLSSREPGKRRNLVRQLLAHQSNYAGHWLSFWNDLLRNEDRFGTYGGDRKTISPWLTKALEDNLPYDRFVATLLNPEKNGPEGFLLGVNWRGDSSAAQMPWMQAAQNSAQVFLGVNLKCNSCHDSFISRWKLADAYNLASFFSPEGRLEMVRCDAATGQHASPKFLYPQLDRPVGETLPERHAAAAAMFTDVRNGRFARTIVNRIWARLMGRGLVEPVDEMDNEPWSPEVLDWLSAEFVTHGYDLRWLLEAIMTSPAYQLPGVPETAGDFVFRGPAIRRLTAEQFTDSISAITGEWPVRVPSSQPVAQYVRESRMDSTPLTRALGRPFRDQVVTERASGATTLQALELVNGTGLYATLARGARRLLGETPPAPRNLFDSLVMRGATKPVSVSLDVTGIETLYLVVADAGSYSPAQTRTLWETESFGVIRKGTSSTHVLDLKGRGLTRFQASVRVDPASHTSDINPAVRFFVFRERPNLDVLVPIAPERPVQAADPALRGPALASRVFFHALGREMTPAERRALLPPDGNAVTAAWLTDFLWALAMTPEFQLII
jgi:hypothetical protein